MPRLWVSVVVPCGIILASWRFLDYLGFEVGERWVVVGGELLLFLLLCGVEIGLHGVVAIRLPDVAIFKYARRRLADETEQHLLMGDADPHQAEPSPHNPARSYKVAAVYDKRYSCLFRTGTNEGVSGWLLKTQALKTTPVTGAILLGERGRGKSTTMKAILLSCANAYCLNWISFGLYRALRSRLAWKAPGRQRWLLDPVFRLLKRLLFQRTWLFDAPPLVPILVRLNLSEPRECVEEFARDNDADKCLSRILEMRRLDLKQFTALLGQGRVAFLLDGLDELPPNLRQPALRFAKQVYSRGSEHPNLVLVTCQKELFTGLKLTLNNSLLHGFEVYDVREEPSSIHNGRAERRATVKKLIRADWRRAKDGTLLASAKRQLAPFRTLRLPLVRWWLERARLIEYLAKAIVDVFENAYPESQQEGAIPKELVTTTFYVCGTRRGSLQRALNGKSSWQFEPKTLLNDYGSIVELDLVHTLESHNKFLTLTNKQKDDLFLLYGELAYNAAINERSIGEQAAAAAIGESPSISDIDQRAAGRGASHVIPYATVQGFVKEKKLASGDGQDLDTLVDAFLDPGIVSAPDNSGNCKFRDEESERHMLTRYLLHEEMVARIDRFIEPLSGSQSDGDSTLAKDADRVFKRLSVEQFKQFVSGTDLFAKPRILYHLLRARPARKQEAEREPMLRRCLRELKGDCPDVKSFRLWLLLRHLVLELGTTYRDLAGDLKLVLESPGAKSHNKAQALLVLAEMANVGLLVELNGELQSVLWKYALDQDSLVACCAITGIQLLFPEAQRSVDLDRLWLTVDPGSWLLGMEDENHKVWEFSSPRGFKMARFPFLVYQACRLQDMEVPRGRAFCPANMLDLRDAQTLVRKMAKEVPGARLPSFGEYEVAAAWSAGSGHRAFPWGELPSEVEDFKKRQEYLDLCINERRFRKLLGIHRESLPVGLKPSLATSSGLYDLVANVTQLSSDTLASDVKGFGLARSGDINLYKCHIQVSIPADHKSRQIGFRVVREN